MACSDLDEVAPPSRTLALSDGQPCPVELTSMPRAAGRAPNGALVLLDVLTPAVLMVDCTLGSVDTLGRVGSGPGEYLRLIALAITEHGHVAVVDDQLARYTEWSRDGKVAQIRSIPPEMTFFRVVIGPDGAIYYPDPPAYSPLFMSEGDRPGRHADSASIYRWDPATHAVTVVATIHVGAAAAMGIFPRVPVRFDPDDAWGVAADGSIWVARAQSNRVDRYQDGILTPGVARPFEPVPTTAADELRRPDREPGPPDSIVWPMAATKPAFSWALVGHDGLVWTEVTRRVGEAHQRYQVFRPGGRAADFVVQVDTLTRLLLADSTQYCTAKTTEAGFVEIICHGGLEEP